MQDLKVITAEQGAIILAGDAGERFRLVVDDALRATLKRAAPIPDSADKPTPRQIQDRIRSGMSAQEIATATGTPLDYIQRFEGPVLAERDFILQSALAVPVHTAMEADPLSPGMTFGAAMQERLDGLGASDGHWTSWKDASAGWVVKLEFTTTGIEHDARWSFDPKKTALAPLSGEAVTLSQQGDASTTLVPRLHAVGGGGTRIADSSRFDSGAFSHEELVRPDALPRFDQLRPATTAPSEPEQDEAGSAEGAHAAHLSTSQPGGVQSIAPSSQTADLLDALRRRRGEREAALAGDEASGMPTPSGGMHLVDVPLADFDDPEDALFPAETSTDHSTGHARTGRRGRAVMPSWDEIVFGPKPDDPA
jgi:hypothetical protein